MATHRVRPRSECPGCFANLSGATNAQAGISAAPGPGDYSVCRYCGQLLRYDEKLNAEIATEEDLRRELDPTQQEVLAGLSRLFKVIGSR